MFTFGLILIFAGGVGLGYSLGGNISELWNLGVVAVSLAIGTGGSIIASIHK